MVLMLMDTVAHHVVVAVSEWVAVLLVAGTDSYLTWRPNRPKANYRTGTRASVFKYSKPL
jgi:hypothetical protein